MHVCVRVGVDADLCLRVCVCVCAACVCVHLVTSCLVRWLIGWLVGSVRYRLVRGWAVHVRILLWLLWSLRLQEMIVFVRVALCAQREKHTPTLSGRFGN